MGKVRLCNDSGGLKKKNGSEGTRGGGGKEKGLGGEK